MSRDHLLRAILPAHDLRVLVCEATSAAALGAKVQGCSPTTAPIFGSSIVGALLAAGLGKDDQRVTLQLAGAGPMRGLFADGSADGAVRGYVRAPEIVVPGGIVDLRRVVGPEGYLSVLRDMPSGEFYRAAVAIEDARLDRTLEQYYATSEQVPTAVRIEVVLDEEGAVARAVGVLVQRLPGGDRKAVEAIGKRLHETGLPLAANGGATLALPLLEDFGEFEVLEDLPVDWRCSCTRERALRGVASAGRDEILDMVVKDRGAELNCEFCKTTYRFDAAELLALLDEMGGGEGA